MLAIAFSAVSVAIALWFRIQYHHQASIWFAVAIGGLGSFLLEILIYRYGQAIRPLVSDIMFNTIISFSDIWALIGGMLITIALPRLAMLRTGAQKGFWWMLFLFSTPLLTFIFGTLFLIGIFPEISVRILQILIFSTSVISIIIISIRSQGDQKKRTATSLKE